MRARVRLVILFVPYLNNPGTEGVLSVSRPTDNAIPLKSGQWTSIMFARSHLRMPESTDDS